LTTIHLLWTTCATETATPTSDILPFDSVPDLAAPCCGRPATSVIWRHSVADNSISYPYPSLTTTCQRGCYRLFWPPLPHTTLHTRPVSALSFNNIHRGSGGLYFVTSLRSVQSHT
jgi:hypothetical protein